MRLVLLVIFLLYGHLNLFSQEQQQTVEIDSLYKEDQFYFGATYNLLGDKPSGVSQSGFSSGFHLGFIKDMPINKRRNVAIGLGIGLSSNSFNQNMLIDEDASGNYSYSILNDSETPYTKNKFTTYLIEAPLEFRWRTSTPTEYKFWRIYTGFKLGYLVANSSKYKTSEGTTKNHNISDFNDFQYGLTLSVGYDAVNLHLYYGLNPVFSNKAKLNGQSLDMNTIKIGLLIYIL